MAIHPHITKLLQCIDLEEKEQVRKYSLDQQHSLKSLKTEGLAIHPIIVVRKNFGYADYPEVSFRLSFPLETSFFKDGAAIECFIQNEQPVKGILLSLDGMQGEFRLFAPDFPEWIEDHGVGIKLAPDTKTTTIMKKVLQELPNNAALLKIFEQLHDGNIQTTHANSIQQTTLVFKNNTLNTSQQQAVTAIAFNEDITIIHGPPGTGKTTTLIEGIVQLVKQQKKVLVSAPSNTAVDNIAKGLIKQALQILRVGNTSKVDNDIYNYTPEGKLNNSKLQKEIKQLKIRAEDFRKMALKYKRSFGKAEREQRNLLFKEVKDIRTQIKKIQQYNEEKLFEEADVILGTPIGLYDTNFKHVNFTHLIVDEAGQCIEPLAWCLFSLAPNIVLAGDHLQLPPTVLSNQAMQLGFNTSILEAAIATNTNVFLLNTQYRMRQAIAGFSSQYFYNNQLQTAAHLQNTKTHITFIDTAGSGYQEARGKDGTSLQNEGEIDIIKYILETEKLDVHVTAIISPYAGQVAAAKLQLPNSMRISTIDSFQGQEQQNIMLSLVRSNDDGDIGFLKDYRRMNVAITRAKENLIIIGDSATLGNDNFYDRFLQYVEKNGCYKTVWELNMWDT